MTEKVAKGIVRRYGKKKDFLSAEDCTRVIHRRYANQAGNKRSTTPKKNRSNSNSQSRR